MRLRSLSAITGAFFSVLVASALAFAAPAGAAASSSATPAPQVLQVPQAPQAHVGTVCKDVVSSGNWHGTICAIVNQSDAYLDQIAQTLITYSIRSGTIKTVSASDLYSYICQPLCGYKYAERVNPSKTVNSGRSSFLSNDWFGPAVAQVNMYAVVVKPCVSWTNGQRACYNGTITSGRSGI